MARGQTIWLNEWRMQLDELLRNHFKTGDIPMMRGVHTMFCTSDAEALRAFIRDKLGFPYTDVGEGWLIFDVPEADMGCHPADGSATAGTHDISFYCEDVQLTMK